MYLPPRARQAAQTLAADQVHQCVPVCLRCCAALSLCAFAGGIAVSGTRMATQASILRPSLSISLPRWVHYSSNLTLTAQTQPRIACRVD